MCKQGLKGGMDGFLSGFFHPILGFDHFLAMIAVGLLSVQIGGRAIWTVPASFVAVLAAGGAIGLAGVPLPQVEGVIAISVLLLGLVIAVERRVPVAFAMVAVGFFALFHGHAHGGEIPDGVLATAYVLGFVLASAVLHLAGVGLGRLVQSTRIRGLLGAGCAGIGLHMVLLSYGVV